MEPPANVTTSAFGSIVGISGSERYAGAVRGVITFTGLLGLGYGRSPVVRTSGTFNLVDAFLLPLDFSLFFWIPLTVICIGCSRSRLVERWVPPTLRDHKDYRGQGQNEGYAPPAGEAYNLDGTAPNGGTVSLEREDGVKALVAPTRAHWMIHAGSRRSNTELEWSCPNFLAAAGRATSVFEIGVPLIVISSTLRAVGFGILAYLSAQVWRMQNHQAMTCAICLGVYELIATLYFVGGRWSETLGLVRKYLGVALAGCVQYTPDGEEKFRTSLVSLTDQSTEAKTFEAARARIRRSIFMWLPRLDALLSHWLARIFLRPLVRMISENVPSPGKASIMLVFGPKGNAAQDTPHYRVPDTAWGKYSVKRGASVPLKLHLPESYVQTLATSDGTSNGVRRGLRWVSPLFVLGSCFELVMIGPWLFTARLTIVDLALSAVTVVCFVVSLSCANYGMINQWPWDDCPEDVEAGAGPVDREGTRNPGSALPMKPVTSGGETGSQQTEESPATNSADPLGAVAEASASSASFGQSTSSASFRVSTDVDVARRHIVLKVARRRTDRQDDVVRKSLTAATQSSNHIGLGVGGHLSLEDVEACVLRPIVSETPHRLPCNDRSLGPISSLLA